MVFNQTFGNTEDDEDAMLCGFFYKNKQTLKWNYKAMPDFSKGVVWTDKACMEMIANNLEECYFEADLMRDSAQWNANKAQKFEISKGQVLKLPTGLSTFMLGLGWDPASGGSKKLDLDASVILLDANK